MTWTAVCVLCARRNHQARLESGHVCVPCASRLMTDIADIARLAADAAAYVVPGSTTGGGSRSVPSSRPPVNVDALDPELAIIDGRELTVLECVESWERMLRDMRGMAPYGPASAERALETARKAASGLWGSGTVNDTRVTLIGCTAFLGAQVAWMTTEPDFPVEDFADEVAACLRVLRRWDADAQGRGTGRVVECPHDDGEGACGYRFRLDGNDVDTYFDCPRCGSEWSVDRLMLVVAETTDASMWLDADAVIGRFGIDRTTLARWVRDGRIIKRHGLYDIKPIALAQRRGA